MQDKMKQIQEEAGKKQVSADSGGGMVTAIVNGRLELIKIRIDKERVDVNDTEMLEDLIVAAVNAAQMKAAEMMRQEMHAHRRRHGRAAGDAGLISMLASPLQRAGAQMKPKFDPLYQNCFNSALCPSASPA